MRETSLVTHHASRIRGCQPPEFLKNQYSLVSAKAELTKDLDEKLKAANVKKSVVKLIQIDVSS